MGGGTPSPPTPPPSTSETRRSALESELEFRPRFREEDVADILRFADTALEAFRGPGSDLAREQQALFEELNPEAAAAEQATANEIITGLEAEGIRPELESAFQRRFAAQEARAGRLGSSVGSANISRQLVQLDEAAKLARLNAGLSFIGRVPGGSPALPFERGVDFGRFVAPSLQSEASIFGTQGNIFGHQVTDKASQRQFLGDIIGASIGAAGNVGAAFVACWVAAEVFGGWNKLGTILARVYVLGEAPDWFRRVYLQYGERLAAWLHRHQWAKRFVRPVFERFALRGLQILRGGQ